jgi:hypothetical protein
MSSLMVNSLSSAICPDNTYSPLLGVLKTQSAQQGSVVNDHE